MMRYDEWGGGGWLLMSLFMLVFWALVIGGIIWVVRGTDHRHPSPPPPQGPPPGWTARQILDERFARGEIDEEEYRQRRSILDQR